MGRAGADKQTTTVRVDGGSGIALEGDLAVPEHARGIVLFAHGSGSSRRSPRNQFVARVLREAGLGTLLFDLLTQREDAVYETRFNIDLLAQRLAAATAWMTAQPVAASLGVGYFGASTGAAAALIAAAELGPSIGAVVSRGGRPDLAEAALDRVTAPTLLIVGGLDDVVIDLNRQAYAGLRCEKRLVIVPGATHLFEEPGTLDEVARLAAEWFVQWLRPRSI
jgi:pimeloyl-ACP methyl ester carboxylesterase